jgi:hypothetical protein
MFADTSSSIIQLVIPFIFTRCASHIANIALVIKTVQTILRAIIAGVVISIIEGSIMAV